MKKPARRSELTPRRRPLRLESLEDRRVLATFTVTSLGDVGQGTLRDAITVANVTPGEDRIEFAANLTGAINTSSQLPLITESLTIAGPGAGALAIDAQQQSRVLEVSDPSGDTDLRIEGLTLQGGSTTGDGGGILFDSEGTLTLVDSVVTGNRIVTPGSLQSTARGGGISSSGDITLVRSSVDNNVAGFTSGFFTAIAGGINAEEGTNVTLINSSVTNNSARFGGGIRGTAYSVISLTGSTVAGNFSRIAGGGIVSRNGTITLTDSTLADNTAGTRGGGIDADGSQGITLTRSTVSGNRTTDDNARGGGIASVGDAGITLIDSTVTGNSTLRDEASGGGISTESADITLINSTVSGNSVLGDSRGGGIHTVSGEVELFNSTVTDNTAAGGAGGIGIDQNFGNQLLRIQNSIVQGNVGTGPGGDLQIPGVFPGTIDIDFSILGDRAGDGLANPSGFGNLLGVDPLLGPLADNGGLTLTHAPLPGSPALDTGDPNFDPGDFTPRLNNDQRGVGFLRVRDADGSGPARVDIGAFEAQFVFEVSSLADTDDGDFSPGELTLREAITLANNSGTDQITFDPALFAGGQTSLNLASQLPTITAPLTITGPGRSLLFLDAGNGGDGVFATFDGFRHFEIDNDSATQIAVSLSGLTILGGDPDANGGAILNRERLTVTDSTFLQNTGFAGGAIATFDGRLTLISSTIRDNRASRGGGLYNRDSELEISRSTISTNTAFGRGGGLQVRRGSLVLEQSTVSGNNLLDEQGIGAGIDVDGDFEIARSTITRNQAPGANTQGGGLFHADPMASADIVGTILSDNNAGGSGDDYADFLQGQSPVNASGNLLGTGVPFGPANLFSDEPKLGLLTNNGGPTQTHLPLEGSPVIDAGTQTSLAGFDQRGTPFLRVFGTRIDIGAVEAQPIPLLGDYNDDGTVDAADYTVWRDNFGQIVTLPNEDPSVTPGQVTLEDRDVWRDNYGATSPATVAVASAITAEPPLQQPAFVEPEPAADAALATLFTPSPHAAALPSSAGQPAASAAATTDDALLLIALETQELNGEVIPEFTTPDDALSEEEIERATAFFAEGPSV